MVGPILVRDPADPRLLDYGDLVDARKRRHLEAAGPGAPHGIFIAEGNFAITRVLEAGRRVRSVVCLPNRLDRLAELCATHDVPLLVVERDVLAAVAGYDVHRGSLACAHRPPPEESEGLLDRARRLLVLEGIGDGENLGALFRAGAALGADGVLLDPTTADPLSRRSVRVSLGHAATLPFARVPDWPGALDDLVRREVHVAVLTPAATALPVTALAGRASGRVALLLGSEGPGLTPAALRHATATYRIPLRAGADSVNVASAAAIALYELARAEAH